MTNFIIDLTDKQSLNDFVNQLEEGDLRLLNRVIVDRLKTIQQGRKESQMARFNIGDSVYFTDKQGVRQSATIIRLNKKTASLMTEVGERWNVAPELLELEATVDEHPSEETIPPGGRPIHGFNVVEGGKHAAKDDVSPVNEWVGGVIRLPAYVDEGNQPYRPEALVWMDADGLVRGMTVYEPGDMSEQATESLETAISSPLIGMPQQPQRLRVADEELIELLESHFSEIEFVNAPTAELDDLVNTMREDMAESAATPTYLSQDLDKRTLAFFFDAAAALYKAAPWEAVPHDECLFSVSIDALDVHQSVLCVIGQLEQEYGILLFESMPLDEQYTSAGDALGRGVDAEIPPHTALTFVSGSDLDQAMRKEISENAWMVAGANAYPTMFAAEPDRMMRPLVDNDLTLFEVLARALPLMLAEEELLARAWATGDPLSRTLTVLTNAGKIDVCLTAPYTQSDISSERDSAIQKMARLVRATVDIDLDVHNTLMQEVEQKFANSPEGKQVGDGIAASSLVMEFAVNYIGDTIATMMPSGLEEILFEIFPRKVMVESTDAEHIIEECRAFYAFLKREYSLTQADACMDMLYPQAVRKLEGALSDTSKAGLGKSLLSMGQDAGFDMSTAEGIDKFMNLTRDLPLPTSFGQPDMNMPSIPSVQKKDQGARKKKRKATRKSRKKNR